MTTGAPKRLFADAYRRDPSGAAGGVANYDVSASGEAFVMVEDRVSEGASSLVSIHVVLNFFEELRAGVPN